MDNLKLILRMYVAPGSAMSDIMDTGRWLFAAAAVLLVSILFFGAVNAKLDVVYRIHAFGEFYQPRGADDDDADDAGYKKAVSAYNEAMQNRPVIPVIGDRFFRFFSFDPGRFYQPLMLLSTFYVPATILLISIFGGIGSFGLVFRRDYATLAVCTLNAWAAAHLPFAIAGIVLYQTQAAPVFYLALWAGSGLLFGIFMIFALRTVFGASYASAIAVVCVAWLSLSLGVYISRFASPWLFSPFILFYAIMYFGGSLGGEVRGFGNAFRQKQNFKRFLHNATVNPRDADAHVQLGIIYLQRRQESKALEHLNKAFEIDKTEIDANFELGKIARQKGDLQKALDHFAVVVELDDKYSLSEIWREIGITYLDANMLGEAQDALEKYVDRRSADVQGLYYLGRVYKNKGKTEKAREMFADAVQSAKASPDFRRHSTKQWLRLAEKELKS